MLEMKQAKAAYEHWLTSDYFDEDTKDELRGISGNEAEIYERFGKDIEFGTGGMRGILGAGTNRINRYTVRRASKALAEYILALGEVKNGVVIAYDSRFGSAEYSLEAALTLAACGIPAYRFESLRPTPELSYAVRKLNCIAGVVITASHNPCEYNGYKVYWQDGGQITLAHAAKITEKYRGIRTFEEIPYCSKQEAEEAGYYHEIGREIDEPYYEVIRSLIIHPEMLKENAANLRIVYTPLHGTGNIPVRTVLSSLGFTDVHAVKEQQEPDGAFTTCEYPNPEVREAWPLALKLAEEISADLALATDPDADRLGLCARDKNGEYVFFTGNMTGILLMDYILRERRKNGSLPEHAAVGKTIVSSQMAVPIAEKYGVFLFETLTGFKYIGEKIEEFETNGDYQFVFGFEESYGCLAGTDVRDKDAVMETALLAEAAAYYHSLGKTLPEVMEELYQEYGYFLEGQTSVKIAGIAGAETMKEIVERMRTSPMESIGGKQVLAIRDYRSGVRRDCKSGEETKLSLPSSNVLFYELKDGWCAVRPSGTEPKIKFYYGVKADTKEEAEASLAALKEALKQTGI